MGRCRHCDPERDGPPRYIRVENKFLLIEGEYQPEDEEEILCGYCGIEITEDFKETGIGLRGKVEAVEGLVKQFFVDHAGDKHAAKSFMEDIAKAAGVWAEEWR